MIKLSSNPLKHPIYTRFMIHLIGLTDNGENITSKSAIENTKITFIPENDLTIGSHKATIEVINKPGYTTMEQWEFKVQLSAVDDGENSAPLEWSLAQNFPNPFNSSTRIQFQAAKTGVIKIEIFSIDGKLVKTLVNDVRNRGSYCSVWNGTDDQNQSIASGIYFYRMTGDGFQDIRRMIYLK